MDEIASKWQQEFAQLARDAEDESAEYFTEASNDMGKLKALIAQLRADKMSMFQDSKRHAEEAGRLAAELSDARLEIAGLRRDAERYRWLRDSAPTHLSEGPVIAMAKADGSLVIRQNGHKMLLARVEADAAIDAAMSDKPEGQG